MRPQAPAQPPPLAARDFDKLSRTESPLTKAAREGFAKLDRNLADLDRHVARLEARFSPHH
jgi:hypothetical protein